MKYDGMYVCKELAASASTCVYVSYEYEYNGIYIYSRGICLLASALFF